MQAVAKNVRQGVNALHGSTAVLGASLKKVFASSASLPAEAEISESYVQSQLGYVSDKHKVTDAPSLLQAPDYLLMGPGPSNPYPRAETAMSRSIIAHMSPYCYSIMDEIQEGLKYVLQTESKYTFGLSASGGAAMETTVANLMEPGDKAVISVAGIWGERFAEKVRRKGGIAITLDKESGETLSFEEIKAAVEEHKPKVFFTTHGESSSGTRQSLEGVGELCAANGTLLAVDTVCTLGGEPFFTDKWGVDVVYSGAQKCIGCPPGLSPMSFSEKAIEAVKARKTPVDSFSFDILEVGKQWGMFGDARPYHHTPPVNILFAMREALDIMAEEGLQASWERHNACHNQLWEGLSELGLKPFVEKAEDRLSTVNCIAVPEGVDAAVLIKHAFDKHKLEISGGLGRTAGKIWRVGLMGYNCTPRNVDSVIAAFKSGLKDQGYL